MWQDSKPQYGAKLKNSKYDKTKKNHDKRKQKSYSYETQFLITLKKSFCKNNLTPDERFAILRCFLAVDKVFICPGF